MNSRPMSALATGGRIVPQDWVDYNGHIMDAYYGVAFTEATEAFLDHLGLGAAYRAESGCGMYTVESHICFVRSVRGGTALRYETQLLGWDDKRLHVFHQMAEQDGGGQVATNELMLLHVDLATERVTPMSPARSHAARLMASAQAALPPPRNAGRRIRMPGR